MVVFHDTAVVEDLAAVLAASRERAPAESWQGAGASLPHTSPCLVTPTDSTQGNVSKG